MLTASPVTGSFRVILAREDFRSQPSPEKRLIEMTAVSVKARAFRSISSGTPGSAIMPGAQPAAYCSATYCR